MNAYHTPVAEIKFPLEDVRVVLNEIAYCVDGTIEIFANDSENWDDWYSGEVVVSSLMRADDQEEFPFDVLDNDNKRQAIIQITMTIECSSYVAEALEEEYLSWRR